MKNYNRFPFAFLSVSMVAETLVQLTNFYYIKVNGRKARITSAVTIVNQHLKHLHKINENNCIEISNCMLS